MLDYLVQQIFPLVISIGTVILLFGGTVFIHELGHFLTAKWFGLRIDAFAVGMGPAIWQKKIGEVVYKICLLPIGGYVALPQMDITGSAFENEDAKDGKLQPVAPWKRIIIAVAGPFMNIVAAFILATIVWTVGKPADPGPGPSYVGYVSEESPAYEAGLREGDWIRKINTDTIKFWADVQISAMLNDTLDIKVVREGEIIELYDVPTNINSFGFRLLQGVGPIESDILFVGIYGVVPDSPAEEAGLQPNDRLRSVNGVDITNNQIFIEAVQGSEGVPLNLIVQSEGESEPKALTLQAKWNEDVERWLIGIEMQNEYARVHPTPLSQISYFQGSIFRTLKAFTRRREIGKAAQGVGGPVMILGSMHYQVKSDPMEALWFTALINVNLAIINLLPLIILDGGHIMVAVFEIITGKKPYKRLIVGLANVMVVVLIGVMVILSFRDVLLFKKIRTLDSDPVSVQTPSPEPIEEP